MELDVIQHDFKMRAEKEEVCEYIDKEIGVDYEVDGDAEGTITIYGMEHDEFEAFMGWLIRQGFVK